MIFLKICLCIFAIMISGSFLIFCLSEFVDGLYCHFHKHAHKKQRTSLQPDIAELLQEH